LWNRQYRLPVFLAVTHGHVSPLAASKLAILYYLNPIFAGRLPTNLLDLQSVAICGPISSFTMIAMTLIDKSPKKLLLIGAVGTATYCLAASLPSSSRPVTRIPLWLARQRTSHFCIFLPGCRHLVYIGEVFSLIALRARAKASAASPPCLMAA